MQITLKGPASTSDLHLCHIMTELKNSSNLYAYLRSLDPTSFENVGIQLESEPYDSESCVTASPGDVSPTTVSPTPGAPNLFDNNESTNAPTTTKPTSTTPTVEPSNPPSSSPTRSPQQPCSTDLWACTDGTYVSRNPDDPMCNFFLCPNETLSPTLSPSRFVTVKPTLVSNPTSPPPTTRVPSSRPTSSPTTGQVRFICLHFRCSLCMNRLTFALFYIEYTILAHISSNGCTLPVTNNPCSNNSTTNRYHKTGMLA